MHSTEVKNEPKVTAARKRWEEPAIVLDRSLIVSAQDGPGGAPGMPQGFVGPLTTSGGSGPGSGGGNC